MLSLDHGKVEAFTLVPCFIPGLFLHGGLRPQGIVATPFGILKFSLARDQTKNEFYDKRKLEVMIDLKDYNAVTNTVIS